MGFTRTISGTVGVRHKACLPTIRTIRRHPSIRDKRTPTRLRIATNRIPIRLESTTYNWVASR